VLALGVLVSGAAFAEEAKKAAVGAEAPNFTLQDQDGKEVSLADYKGKVVVLEWFNEECPFVVKFYREGHMNKLADQYKSKDVVWLAINSTKGKDISSNKAIAEKWSINRPLLSDADGKVGKLYGATNTPHMYVIDTEGKLVYAGAIDSKRSDKTADIESAENYVTKALDAVLAGETVTTPQTKAYGCTVKYAK
jgi:peroxiredoxin